MTQPGKHEKQPHNPDNPQPDESTEQKGSRTPLHQAIRTRVTRPHKGDVGRAGTNEEIFQGYKEKELR